MTQLLDLPEEIILEIITKFLDLSGCVHLIQTCRSLHKFTRLKAFWVAVARRAQPNRPIPIPEDWSKLEAEKIKDTVLRSTQLGRMLEGTRIPEPKKIWTIDLEDSDHRPISTSAPKHPSSILVNEAVTSSKETDPQVWVWLLSDGIHVMSMSLKGILRLFDIVEKNSITSFDVMGVPLCWDYTMDAVGITIIINIGEVEDESDTFRVWRYDWGTPSVRLIFTKQLSGDIRSNYIEGNLAGCVGNTEDGPTYIYVLNWVTMKDTYIETPFRLPPNLSAATSSEDLFIYAEDTNYALYYSYSLADLYSRLSDSTLQDRVRPTDIQHCVFTSSQLDAAETWVPTCRRIWDGRTGIFSRGVVNNDDQAGFVTLSMINLQPHGTEGSFLSSAQRPKSKGKSVNMTNIERKAVFVVREGGIVTAPSPSDWDLCAMGSFGKTVVWLEYEQGSDVINEEDEQQRVGRVCFAEFPAMSTSTEEVKDEDDESTIADSTMATVGDSHSSDHGEPSNNNEEHLELASLNDASLVEPDSPLQEPNTELSDDSIEDFDLMAMLESIEDNTAPLVRPPTTYGHICELPVPPEWAVEHGGIYTVDFDDARGRLAFATGNGKILIWELV